MKGLTKILRWLAPMLAATVVLSARTLPQGATPPPQAPPQTPATNQTDQKRPVFYSSSDLVLQTVTARDSEGRFVPDLKEGEITILEDGVAQKIVSMSLALGERTVNVLRPSTSAVPEGIILPPSRPTADVSGRIWVIFVDDLHLQAGDTPKVKSVLEQMGSTLIHPGDRFVFQTTGPSSVYVDNTYDKRRFDEAVHHIVGSGQSPKEIIESPSGSDGPTGVRYTAGRSFSTAYDLLQNLEKVPLRKAFIYVSNGYDFDPFPNARQSYQNDLYGLPNQDPSTAGPAMQGALAAQSSGALTNPFENQGNEFAQTDLIQQIGELTREANRANVSFFTVDPRGLTTGSEDLISQSSNDQIPEEDMRAFTQNTQDTLRVLAQQTGGIAVVNQNDFVKAFKEIDNMTSDYYVLGYYSSNPDPLHRTRKIEIRITRPGVVASGYRTAYSLKLPGKAKGGT